MITSRNLADGRLKKEEGLQALSKGLFQCTFCAACEQECMLDIPLTEVYSELKTMVQDYIPFHTKRMFSNLKVNNNFYGLDQEDRSFWASEVESLYNKFVNRKAQVGYFIGCVSSYSARASGAPVSLLKLVEKANEKISVFSPSEYCCGNPYLLGGQPNKALELAKHNIHEIERLGIKTLIISCAGCFRVFTKEYPKIIGKSLPFKVITHMDYIISLIKKNKFKFTNNKSIKVSFKDPCELGRHCGEYEHARELINLLPGIKNCEMENNRENALCCGAGGLVKANYPEIAEDVAEALIQQLEDQNVDYCLNACPACQINIDEHLNRLRSSIRSIDIMEIVLSRIQ